MSTCACALLLLGYGQNRAPSCLFLSIKQVALLLLSFWGQQLQATPAGWDTKKGKSLWGQGPPWGRGWGWSILSEVGGDPFHSPPLNAPPTMELWSFPFMATILFILRTPPPNPALQPLGNFCFEKLTIKVPIFHSYESPDQRNL